MEQVKRNLLGSQDSQEISESYSNPDENTRLAARKEDTKRQLFLPKDADIKHVSKINKVCCININNHWKMQSQIRVAFLILFLTIFLTLISITSYNIMKVSQIMLNSQNQLYISEAQKNLQIVSKKFDRLVTAHFQAVQKDIIQFQKIYRIVSESNESKSSNDTLFDTPYSESNLTQFQQGFYYSWVCYAAFVKNQNESRLEKEDDKFSIYSIQQFNQIHPLIVNQNYTYLVTFQSNYFWTTAQIAYFYPCYILPVNFTPQTRGWYIETKLLDQAYRNNNKIFDGFHMNQPIFNNITYTTIVAIAKILLDRKYNFKGISGSLIDLSKFSNLFDLYFTQLTALLVNPNGQLLISPYSVVGNNMGLFFQNSLITGFNDEDWQQVQNLAKGLQTTHNCSLLYLNKATNILCRWNQLHLRSELIFASYQKHLGYYIVILLDEEELLIQLYVQQQYYENQLIYTNIIFSCSVCGLFILILLCSQLLISMIFKPLRNITTYCQQINNKNHLQIVTPEKDRIYIQDILTKGVFHKFTLSFYNLVQKFTGLRKQRNRFCKQVEQINYSKKDTRKLNLKEISNLLEDTNEDIDSVLKWKGSIQLHYMDQYQLKKISTTPREVNQINNQKFLKKLFQRQLQNINHQYQKFKYFNKELVLKLIFQFYKKR